jgi:hypothetical protein
LNLIQVYFKNYLYKTKNILQIIKLKNVTMRSSPLYDVKLTVIDFIFFYNLYRGIQILY